MKLNTVIATILYLIFSIGITLSADVTYTHTDALGSVIAESDESGKVIKSYHYAPYGESIPSVKNNNPGYTGHVYDNDLGLSYMKARYYDPEIGRFYSNDPVGFSADNTFSFNRYAYANNNPYKFVDPDGRYVETAWDVFNVGLGLASLSYNINEGNWGGAALDTVGLAYDGFATAVPFLPAGLGTAIKAGRTTKKVTGGTKRLPNKLEPDKDAVGPHSSFRRDENGRVSNYATYDKNLVTGKWEPAKRFRGSGKKHGEIEPPLVLERAAGKGPGSTPVVPKKPDSLELPKGY